MPPAAAGRRWPVVVLAVPASAADDIGALCFVLGSCGVHTEDGGQEARLHVYFEAPAADLPRLGDDLVAGLRGAGLWPPGARVAGGRVEGERNWNEAWKAYYKPVWATPNIVVHPPWLPVPVGPGQVAIQIDPAMAFGTGGHESTQLALQAIEQVDPGGRRCLDVGTGSAILAIALVRLGAAHVTAVDTDPVVIGNARDNLRANLGQEAARVRLLTGSVDTVAGEPFDVIVANIEGHLLRPLLPGIADALAPGGVALFSGLVEGERERFLAALAEVGLVTDGTWSKNDWFSCRARASG